MSHDPFANRNSKSGTIALIVCILMAVFWWLAKTTNIYRFAAIGAIFEILWLPMLGCLFIFPVVSLVFWRKDKFNPKSAWLYSLLIATTTAVLTVIAK